MDIRAPHPIVTQLVEIETLKTWSLIVTLFGDLDGKELSGTQIRMLLGHIGTRPEAIRVALHRLKSDGWIDSAKNGREAVYWFSDLARRETDAVAADVYGRNPKHPDGWEVQFIRGSESPKNAIALGRDLVLVPKGGHPVLKDTLVLEPTNGRVPDWLSAQLVPEPIQAIAQTLSSIVQQHPARPHGLDKMAIRLLALHHWRRIALRSGSWAHVWFWPNGPIAQCQKRVTKFFQDTPELNASLWQQDLEP